MDRRKADKVADDLLRQIVVGDLSLGEILPKEAALAALYQVNRSVIREAIKLLEVHRLVKPVRRKGTEVLDPNMSLSPEVIRVMIQPRPGQIDTAILHDLLEIRAELDAQLSMLAAQRRSEEDLALFDSFIETLETLLEQPKQYSDVFDQLSLAIARSTHNRIFEMLVHWHHRIQKDLGELLLSARFATHKHNHIIPTIETQRSMFTYEHRTA